MANSLPLHTARLWLWGLFFSLLLPGLQAKASCRKLYAKKLYSRAASCFHKKARRQKNIHRKAFYLRLTVRSYIKITRPTFSAHALRSSRNRRLFLRKRARIRRAISILKKLQRAKLCPGRIGRKCRNEVKAFLRLLRSRARSIRRTWRRARKRTKTHPPPPRLPGTIDISSKPSGAIVLIDDEHKGRTPITLTIPPGTHKVRIELDGYEPRVEAIDVLSGQRRQLNFNLQQSRPKRSFGILRLNSVPSGAMIFIDGANYGKTPLRVRLPSGQKQLVLKKRCYETLQKIIRISPNTPQIIQLTLSPSPEAPELVRKRAGAQQRKILGLIGVIVGGVAMAASLAIHVSAELTQTKARTTFREYRDCTSQACAQNELDNLFVAAESYRVEGNTMRVFGYITLGSGALLTGVGISLLLSSTPPPKSHCQQHKTSLLHPPQAPQRLSWNTHRRPSSANQRTGLPSRTKHRDERPKSGALKHCQKHLRSLNYLLDK